jgi:amino acid transporter
VFIGIEGASVYSARAANRADVGRATIIGFLCALAIYVLVSILSTGVMTQAELAGLKVPSMAGALASIVGDWGAALISIGLIVSVGGAFLSWTLLCAEIPYTCAHDGTFPKWFGKENANGSPANSLWATNLLIQAFLILSLFSKSAYQFFYFIGAKRERTAALVHAAATSSSGRLRRSTASGSSMPPASTTCLCAPSSSRRASSSMPWRVARTARRSSPATR